MITSILEFKLNEAKNIGNLYHFTDIFSLIDITHRFSEHEPKLRFNPDDFNEGSGKFFISTTRKFNFKWNAIRFTLDGNKISHKYKIEPVSYFSKKPNHVNTDPQQFEERIITFKKDEMLDLNKYCKQVDICTDPNYDSYADTEEGDDILSHMEDVETAIAYFNELRIAANIVSAFKPTKY